MKTVKQYPLRVIGIVTLVLLTVFLNGCQENRNTSLEPSFPSLPDPRPTGLPAPKLSLGVGIESGDYTLHWTPTPKVESYTVEADQAGDFRAPLVVYSGPETIYYLGFPSDYILSFFYRVRAERSDSISGWSDPVVFP